MRPSKQVDTEEARRAAVNLIRRRVDHGWEIGELANSGMRSVSGELHAQIVTSRKILVTHTLGKYRSISFSLEEIFEQSSQEQVTLF